MCPNMTIRRSRGHGREPCNGLRRLCAGKLLDSGRSVDCSPRARWFLPVSQCLPQLLGADTQQCLAMPNKKGAQTRVLTP